MCIHMGPPLEDCTSPIMFVIYNYEKVPYTFFCAYAMLITRPQVMICEKRDCCCVFQKYFWHHKLSAI